MLVTLRRAQTSQKWGFTYDKQLFAASNRRVLTRVVKDSPAHFACGEQTGLACIGKEVFLVNEKAEATAIGGELKSALSIRVGFAPPGAS